MADLPPSALTGVFHQPFAEQVAFFRAKLGNLVPTTFWDDLIKGAHDTGFMVAGAAKADLLSDLAAAVDRAISEGTSIEAFRKDFRVIVARHGWTGWTGEKTVAGRAWRTRIIYTTNAQTSYSAGRLAQLREGGFPFWVYRHTDGELHPRALHVSWNGLTLPADHRFWKTHYPPNDWGCLCYVLGARNPEAARRLGGNPEKQLQKGWDAIDPKTGEQIGIGEGWGYMPGDTVSDAVREAAGKIQHWDYTLAKAYMQNVPEAIRDSLATSYRNLPSAADDARRYAQRVLSKNMVVDTPPYRTLGLTTSKQTAQINGLKRGIDVSNYDFALDANGIRHIQEQHGNATIEAARNQQAVTAADYAMLPRVLTAPNLTITYAGQVRGMQLPGIRITARIDGKAYVTVWGVQAKRRMLVLRSFFIGAGKAKP